VNGAASARTRAIVRVAVKSLVVCGAALLALGTVIWTGNGDALIPVHIAIGVVLVLALWTIAAIAARSGVPVGTVTFAVAWGVGIVLLGLAQEDLMTGGWHWVVQVLHVALSMGAIWWGRRLATLMRQRSAAGATEARPVASPVPR
jgi:hypothetical protein